MAATPAKTATARTISKRGRTETAFHRLVDVGSSGSAEAAVTALSVLRHDANVDRGCLAVTLVSSGTCDTRTTRSGSLLFRHAMRRACCRDRIVGCGGATNSTASTEPADFAGVIYTLDAIPHVDEIWALGSDERPWRHIGPAA